MPLSIPFISKVLLLCLCDLSKSHVDLCFHTELEKGDHPQSSKRCLKYVFPQSQGKEDEAQEACNMEPSNGKWLNPTMRPIDSLMIRPSNMTKRRVQERRC